MQAYTGQFSSSVYPFGLVKGSIKVSLKDVTEQDYNCPISITYSGFYKSGIISRGIVHVATSGDMTASIEGMEITYRPVKVTTDTIEGNYVITSPYDRGTFVLNRAD